MAGIDINDERLVGIKNEGAAKEAEVGAVYDDIVAKTDDFYNRIDQSLRDYGETQKQLQEQRTDFTIDTINQQKEQLEADYLKEQKGAYADWQKESNRYGANAEAMAANGLAASGYSESSQVAMFNAYQNRVATARESYDRAVLNYDNAIKDAQLQGSSALAELAFNTLQTQLQNQLQGFQYKNQLLLEKTNQKLAINQLYYNRYIDQVSQINAENALAEEKRQYDESMKLQQAQFAWQKAQAAKSSSSGGYIKKNNKKAGDGVIKASNSAVKKLSAKNSENKNKLLSKVDSVKTYDQAQAFLLAYPIKTGDTRLLTNKEWTQAKKNGGQYSEAEYATYEQYAQAWLRWRIEESY